MQVPVIRAPDSGHRAGSGAASNEIDTGEPANGAAQATDITPADSPGIPFRERYVSAYTDLRRQITDSGLLKRRYGYYWTKIIITVALFAGIWVAFAFLGNSWFQLVLAALLAVILAQFGFLGHDGAHRQIFNSHRWNEWASRVMSGLFTGLSYGWWQNKHNRHHAHPNTEDKDPDIDIGALAALYTGFASAGDLARAGRIGGWGLVAVLLAFTTLFTVDATAAEIPAKSQSDQLAALAPETLAALEADEAGVGVPHEVGWERDEPPSPEALADAVPHVFFAPDRSAAATLAGATLADDVYVFTTPDAGIDRVRFWLDNPTMSGTPRKTEGNGPFDFAGTAADGSALPFDTNSISNGTHSITAALDLVDGTTQVVTASFAVSNP